MNSNIHGYFEETVLPFIANGFPEIASEMSVQVTGSFGLGIADEHSDLDALIWLDDPAWKRSGGQLQLALNHLDIPFVSPQVQQKSGHEPINVWPLSWLGARRDFLGTTAQPRWEQVTFEELFDLQECLVLHDPQEVFKRLREATKPERFPAQLWDKHLVLTLKKLADDLWEFRQAVTRRLVLETHAVSARALEDLLQIGFIINRRYRPWRTHLRWAFDRLPLVASEVVPCLETIASCADPETKLEAAEAVLRIYKTHIRDKRLLSAVDVFAPDLAAELTWAERLRAWSDPDWRDWTRKCERLTVQAGHTAKDAWVWSLWGWAKEDTA
jgi:hypothetical protein